MKIRTTDLIGPPLDWAVAEIEYARLLVHNQPVKQWVLDRHNLGEHTDPYSTDWAWGGLIIEREGISHGPARNGKFICAWKGCASDFGLVPFYSGPTVLVAAMRCYVASRLGEEVEIPENLCGTDR